MSINAIKLLQEALKLPVEARAALAGWLLDRLDGAVDADVEQTWALEIARRLDEVRSGKVRGVPWSAARRTIRDA